MSLCLGYEPGLCILEANTLSNRLQPLQLKLQLRLIFHYRNYILARSEYNITNKFAYKNSISRIKSNIKSNSKSFYKFVNSKSRSSGYKLLKCGSPIAEDDILIRNAFTAFFSTTFLTTGLLYWNILPLYKKSIKWNILSVLVQGLMLYCLSMIFPQLFCVLRYLCMLTMLKYLTLLTMLMDLIYFLQLQIRDVGIKY